MQAPLSRAAGGGVRLPGREDHVLRNRGTEPTDSPPRVLTQHRRGCQASTGPREQAGIPVVATALAQGGSSGGQDGWPLGQRSAKGLHRPTGRRWAFVHP